jgi:hypothetical protein
MPVPAGYSVDSQASGSAALPAGYKLDTPDDTKPGLDTFKANMGQVGSIGEYLHAAKQALGLPSIDDLMHLPASVINWAKHGNPPSGGFLSENPTADAFATATSAALPPDVASAKSAAGNVAAAGKAGLGAGAKALVEPKTWTGAGVAGMAAHEIGLDPALAAGAVGGGRVVSAAARAARKALTDRATAAVAPVAAVAEDTELLDGLAQSQTGRKFANLPAEQQAAVRSLASRLQAPPPARPAAGPPPPPAPSEAIQPPPEALAQLNAEAPEPAPGPQPPAPDSPVAPPPEAQAQLNSGVTPKPAASGASKGRMSRAQMQANEAASLARSQKSAEDIAQFITRDPKQAQAIVDSLESPEGLPDDPDQARAVKDGNWKALKQLMKQDQLARVEQAGGQVGQSEVMNLKNGTAPSLVTRRLALKRVQEILQQNAATSPRQAAPAGGMGAMKQYRGSYNPAALTDEEIAAVNR